MKVLKIILGTPIGISLLATISLAQKKSDLTPLAPEASLAETQTWLTRALTVSGFAAASNAKRTIESVRFDGCQLSLTQKSEVTFLHGIYASDDLRQNGVRNVTPLPSAFTDFPGSASQQPFPESLFSARNKNYKRTGKIDRRTVSSNDILDFTRRGTVSLIAPITPPAVTRNGKPVRYPAPKMAGIGFVFDPPLPVKMAISVKTEDAPLILDGLRKAAALCMAANK